jgi:hypothetical protein
MTVQMAVSSSRPLLSIAETEPTAGWRWPIAIDRYDRSVDLTPGERAALTSWIKKQPAGGSGLLAPMRGEAPHG